MILVSARTISEFVLIALGVVLYIVGTVLRAKNQKRNAYYLELLGLVLITIYQGLRTSFSFTWGGLSSILLLAVLVCIIISKLFLRRK